MSSKENQLLIERLNRQDIAQLTVGNNSLVERITSLQNQNDQLQKQINRVSQELSQIRNERDQLQLQKQKEGSNILTLALIHIEIDHLRTDNARLIQLLKQQGYTEFYDVDAEYGVRYLKEVEALAQTKEQAQKLIQESLLWVPRKAYEFTQEFKLKYGDELLSNQQIELLLFELNKIWAFRENSEVKKIKQHSIDKMKAMQRQKQKPYNEFMLAQKVNRLSGQVKDLQRENIDLYANRPARASSSMVVQRDRVRSSIEQRRESLQNTKAIEQLKTMNLRPKSDTKAEKQNFIDGAIWMCAKLKEHIPTAKEIIISQQKQVMKMYNNI